MKITRSNKKIFDPAESGTLNDLAFLLIIYFIVIATFNVNKGFLLALPQKASTKVVNVEDIIRVNLNSEGKLFYQNKEMDISALEDTIIDRLKIRPNLTFLLKIDPDTPYQNVVDIIDTVRKLNVDNFSFSMDEK